MRALCISISFLILCGLTSNAQKLSFERIGVENGLPSSEVYNLFQDSKGYLWVFTEYGIVKYNGSKYVRVCNNLSSRESAIYAVNETSEGTMFIANSKAKVYRIRNDKAYFVKGLNVATKDITLYGKNIYDLFFDNKDDLWFSTLDKSYHFRNSTLHFSKPQKKSLKRKKETSVFPAKILYPKSKKFKNEEIKLYWFGSKVEIIYNDSDKRDKWFMDTVQTTRLCARIRNGKSYLSYRNKLFMKEGNRPIKTYVFKDLIINFEISPSGNLWVGLTNGGLRELDENLNLLDHYFENAIISDVLFDNQNGLWISTIGEGLFHCKNIDQKSFSNIPQLRKNCCLIKRVKNKLFIANNQGDLFVDEGKGLRDLNLKGNRLITDIAFFDGKYFISTIDHIETLDSKLKALGTFPGASFGFTPLNSRILIIVFYSSIGSYNAKTNTFNMYLKYHGKNRGAALRHKNEFFTATPNGVSRFYEDKFTYPPYLSELKNKNIFVIKSDQSKNIWFCTKGDGAYRLDVKNKLNKLKNLPSEIINDISFTETGLVLLSTNNGAFVNRIENLEKRTSWKLILDGEIMKMEQFDGKIYIGSKTGLTIVDNKKLFTENKYKFYLKSITANQREINTSSKIDLNYNQNNLILSYDYLNYQSKQTSLNCQLIGPVGLNEVVPSTKIRLQNLVPGEYTLTVSPQTQFQGESPPIIKTKIVIYPAFWQTLAFKILIGTVFIAFLFLIFWYFNYRKNKKQEEIAQIENLLTEYRLTALKSQINPHFMSNSLVAIQRLILEDETDKANQYLAKFSLLLRSLLEYSSKSSALISEELKMIQLYVELEQLRFSHQFVFELKIDPKINLKMTYMPALITQPFVENAIWHGLLPLNGVREARLVLELKETREGIVISITDNGVGRQYSEGNKKEDREFESKGTSLIIQRMENLNRLYNSTSGRIEYIDLIDEDKLPVGTQVNIYLPIEILNQLYEKRNS